MSRWEGWKTTARILRKKWLKGGAGKSISMKIDKEKRGGLQLQRVAWKAWAS